MTFEDQLRTKLDSLADLATTPDGFEEQVMRRVDQRQHRRQFATSAAVVMTLVGILAVGVTISRRGPETFTPANNTNPYVVLRGAAFPNETFTVTAFRKDGQDCVQANSAITGGYCNPGMYDAVARGQRPSLLAAVVMPDRTQALWFGAVNPDVKEFVLELRSGETRTVKPVPPQTAGTSLPVIALYVPDQREVLSIKGRRADGSEISQKDLFSGPQ